MNAENRRQAILTLLSQSDAPVSAGTLASRFSVSRQIIVGDIALLRAAGADISAICNEAVMTAVRRLVSQGKVPDDEEIAACKVTQDDFLKAVDKFGPKAAERLKAYGDLGKVPTE